MSATILMVRHGQSLGNVAGVFTGHSGYPLSNLGHEQAARTAEYIRANYSVDAVYSSDLPRAFQTAEYIAKAFKLPIVTDSCFREIRAAEWENCSFVSLLERFPDTYSVWLHDIGNSRCDGGEAAVEVADRVVNGLLRLGHTHEGECVVVASHATPVRAALWKISGTSPEEMQKIPWGGNCSVSEFRYTNGVLELIQGCYTGHLEGCETSLPSSV